MTSWLDPNAPQKFLDVFRILDENLGRGHVEDGVELVVAKGAENTGDRQRSPFFRGTLHSRRVKEQAI